MIRGTVFDIEADGLKPTKIHCMSWYNGGNIYSTTDYEEITAVLRNSKYLIGHNIQRYDIPALERLLRVKFKAKLIDTLALSWYLSPDRPRHGLESYGNDFGIEKPKIDDWENLSEEEYIHRCEEDVKINTTLWKQQRVILEQMYPDEQELIRFLSYIEFKLDCAREQEENGWKLDVDRAIRVLQQLLIEKEDKVRQLTEAMPPVQVWATKNKPAKLYKKNGDLSEAGKDWVGLLGDRFQETDSVKYIKDTKLPNPNSHIQIKDWLFSLGWKPSTFIYKRDKETGDLKKIPQIQQDKTKGPGLCESVKKLFDKHPELEVLDGLSIISHRITILEGFLKNVDENDYVKAEIQGFTNTLRFKHSIIVNLPSVDRVYGDDIRGCLVAPDGHELAGSDMSSLEDRCKQHYMFPYDPEFVEEMTKPGFDPHLDLAYSAGAVNDLDVKAYKEHEDKRVKTIRHTYKQGNYASTYGAGPPRIALTVGCTLKEAQAIHEAYWKRNWSVKKIGEDQTIAIFDGRHWLYNPVSRFWYSLRNTKDVFSTLNQGTGVYCFDTYLKHIREGGVPIIGQFHDEWIAVIKLGNRERLQKHVNKAIERTNEELGLNRALSVELKFGTNYGAIH
jgi:hypothetical protein